MKYFNSPSNLTSKDVLKLSLNWFIIVEFFDANAMLSTTTHNIMIFATFEVIQSGFNLSSFETHPAEFVMDFVTPYVSCLSCSIQIFYEENITSRFRYNHRIIS